MNLIEKIIEEKISRYGIWWLTFFAAISIFTLSWFKNEIVKKITLPFDISFQFDWILLTVSWILLIIFSLWIFELVKEKIYWPIYSIFRNRINLIPRISKWIFQGSFKIIGDFLEITASNSGCLIRDYLYRNFVMSFKLKILNGGRAGIIFRAQNLENYLMLEIVLNDVTYSDGKSSTIIYDIVPWIRFLGSWECFNITPEAYFRKAINLQEDMQKKMKYSSDGLKFNLEVKDYIVNLTIRSDSETEEFHWNIPTHTETNIFKKSPDGIPLANGSIGEPSLGKNNSLDGNFVPKIWFRNKYGRVGFRAHAWQIVRISELKIEKI